MMPAEFMACAIPMTPYSSPQPFHLGDEPVSIERLEVVVHVVVLSCILWNFVGNPAETRARTGVPDS